MVEIDVAHAQLIDGLVRSFKPQNILECGFGGGRAHNAIAYAAKYNGNKPHYTLVDSWHDWNFVMPPEAHETVKRHSLNHKTKENEVNTFESFLVVSTTEQDFVNKALRENLKYDFIMMDADHQHSHEWSENVFHYMLDTPGILIYHDVDGSYPGLGSLPGKYMDMVCDSVVFNRITREDEECKRGLLVIFKR